MFKSSFGAFQEAWHRGAALIALLALVASGLVALETPTPANAAVVSSNLVVNLDGSNTSSLAASSATTWTSVSPASSTASGTFFGNTSRYSDATGAGITNDGDADAVVFPVGTGRTPGSMTVETWIKPGALRNGWNIIATRWFSSNARASATADWHFAIYPDGSNYRLQLNTSSGAYRSNKTFSVASDNKWYQVGFSIDSSDNSAKFWVNGALDSTATGVTHTDSADAQLHVGDVGATSGVIGPMSRFRIYNKALSASEIAQNFLTDSSNFGYAPANTVAPTLVGAPKVGTAFSVTNGTWGVGDADGTTTSYQWQTSVNGSTWTNISGATAASYTPVANDATNYLRASVTKTNTAGSATSTTSTSLRVQTSTGSSILSGGIMAGLTGTVPNDGTTYNVTLSTNNLAGTLRLGTTTDLTLVSGYASTASFMATTIGSSAPIISFRGTGFAINTALANVLYTSATQQTDVVKLFFATAGATTTDTKNYIPIYDNNQLKFHYYAYKVHASGKNRAGMDASVAPLSTTDGVAAPGPWYLATPRYQVEWDRLKIIVGQNQAYMGARADAGSSNWYWPFNTDSFTSGTIFGTQSGTTVTATSNIFNQTNTTLPFHSGEPNAGTGIGRSGFFYINGGSLGWDDTPLDNTGVASFTMETFGSAPFDTGAAGVLSQTVNVVANAFDAPSGLTVEASGTTGLAATWNPVTPNVTGLTLGGYRLEYSTSSSFSPLSVVITQPTVTSGMIPGLAANTTYYVRVLATGTTWGAYSPAVTVTTKSAATTITVVSSGGGVDGTDYTLSGGNLYAKSSNSVSVNASVVQTALASGNVVLAADNVIIDAPITWSSSQYLTLGNSTSSSVTINKNISSSGNGSLLQISPATYTLDVKSGASIQFTGLGTQYLNIGGTAYTLIKTEAQLIATTATATAALAKPLTLTTTYTAAPLNLTFTGTLDGLGNAVNSMRIATTTAGEFGLFARLGGSTVRNVGLTNVNLSSSVAGESRLGALAGNGSSAGTNTVTQVWVTGFISQTANSAKAEVGGLFGGATAGTLAISKSWNSAAVSTEANSIGSGGIIGTNVSTYSGGSGTGNTLTIDESYSTGNILRNQTAGTWYGNGGIIGVTYGVTATLRNVFSWGTINSTGPSAGVSTGGIVGVTGTNNTTVTNAYTTHPTVCGGTATNCIVNQTAGAAVVGGTGFTTGLWQSVNGTSLVNLAAPTKVLYVKVVAPTDGSYSTITYQILDSTGTVQNPLPTGVTISGTPTYSIASDATIGTYASVNYSSGLTLGGSSAGVYSLATWITSTSVTISKYSQTVTWAPTTNVAFGNGSFTASNNPVASGNTAITYSVASAGTTGCSVNSALGLVTYLSGGTCSITATAAASGNFLGAATTVNFVIQNAPTLTIVASGGGLLGTNYTIASGVLSASSDVSINAADLATALASGSVQLAGNVIINSPITWSANTVLTLGGTTSNTVSINAKLTASGNTAGIAIRPTTYSLDVKTGASLVLSGTAPTLSIGGTNYTLIETIADLTSVTATGNFALAVPLSYSSGVTTAPIAVNFAGTFDGLGNTVNALSITHTAAGSMGFIRTLAGGTVRNLGVTNLLISLEPAAATYNNNVGGLAGDSTGGTLSQVWTTGFMRVKSGSTYVGLALGGLVGDVYSGTLNVNRSWSSLNIDASSGTYTHQVNGGVVGTTVGAWSATASTAGGSVTMNQVYYTGDLRSLHKTGTYGQGGLLGVHLGTGSVNITDAFSWGTIFIGSGSTNYGGILGFSSGTAAYLYTTFTNTNQLHPTGSSVNGGSNSSWSVGLGFTPGFTTNSNFASGVTGFSLTNLAVPYKNLFIRVLAPTDGSFGTMAYRMSTGVDTAFSSGSIYTITGTPIYSIASNVAISPTPYQVDYASGLTFTYIGSGTNVYKISNFGFPTPVTISKYPQTITWAPTTSVAFGSGSITPSALASASTSITYAVTDAGTTGCTVNSTTAVITATSGGTCSVTATAANAGNYLASSVAVAFTIANASAAPSAVGATVGGVSSVNLSWTGPTPSASTALTGYEIIYSTSAAMTSPTTVTSSTTTRYITGLTAGTTYYFQVRAVNGTSWYGVFSSAVSASTSATASTTLTVAASGGVEGSSWKNSNGVIYPIGTGIINAGQLQNLLLDGSVQLAADTVIVNSDIAWPTSQTLTLGYATTNTVQINANILVSGATGGLVITPATYSLDVKSSDTIAFTGANTTLSIGGSAYTLIRSEAALAAVTAAGNFALARPLTLTTAYTAAPITAVFTGTLDGLGNAISGLNISATATSTNGLFGTLSSGAKVRNLGVTSAKIVLATGSNYYRAGFLAGMTQTGSVSIDQVWTSGSITATGTAAGISAGGIVGTAVSGTLSITKSWSNSNIDTSTSSTTTVLDQGGIIGGDSSGWAQANSAAGGVVSLTEVYAIGTQKWASTGHRGIGGIFGLHYNSSGAMSITDAFSWVSFVSGPTSNRGGILGVGYGSQTTLTRTYQATDSVCTGDVTLVTQTPSCTAQQTPGAVVAGISGAAWTNANGTTLVNLATPKIQIYAKVVAPTDGSYATVGYQFVDGTGTVRTLSTMNLSASGTPTYSIASNVANGTYATTYASGLTLGGTAASNYELYPWTAATSVAITKQAQTVSFSSTIPASPKVGQTYSVSATATSSLAVALTIDTASAAICSISGSTVTFSGLGSCVVNANQSGSTGYTAASQVQQTMTVAKGAQTLTFTSTAPTTAQYGSTYTATATGGGSGSAVVLTVDATAALVCSISSGVVSYLTLGTCVVNANQAGSANYDAATQAQQTFTVVKGDQTISFTSSAPTTAKVGGASYTVTGSATSSLTPLFTIDPTSSSVCVIAAAVVTFNGVGTCKVLADQSGNTNWNAASQVSQSFSVAIGTQSVSFSSTSPATAKVGGTNYSATATSTSGLTVALTSATSAVCTISSGTVSFVAAGTCTLNANQAGTSAYSAATQVQQTFTVAKGDQTITLTSTAPSSAKFGSVSYTVTGTSSSALSVVFTSATTGVCTVASGVVTVIAIGTCTLNANQAGDTSWNLATQVQQSFVIVKGDQTISYNSTALLPKVGGSNYTVSASSNSALTLSLASATAGVCTISGSVVTFVASGTCTINADQAGTTNWNAATQTAQTFSVGKGDQTITFTSTAPTSANVSGATYTPVATSTSAGTPTFTIDAASSPVCSITGGVVSFNSVGNCKVLANQVGNDNWNAATSNFQTFAVAKGGQTLAFSSIAPSAKVGGASYTPAASSLATGSAVFTIDSSATGVCSITAGVVTFQHVGDCVINANKAADANYLVASQVQQTFTVAKQSQVLSFTSVAPTTAVYQGATYTPTVSGGASGNAISLTVDPAASSICSIAASVVSFIGVGSCVLNINQAGNSDYLVASQVQQTFTVSKTAQTLSFTSTAPTAAKVGLSSYTPAATSAATGSTVFTIDAVAASICSISGGVVTFDHVGTCVINANKGADSNYSAATQVQQSFAVAKASQAISFTSTAPEQAKYAGATYAPTATGGLSGNLVTFTIDSAAAAVCSISAGVVSFISVGNCVLNANQAGSSDYLAAPVVQQSFAVAKASQLVTFTSGAPLNAKYSGATYLPTATGGGSTSLVTFTVAAAASEVCSISNGIVSFIGVGDCVLNANQTGDANYLSATQVQQSFQVGKASQSIAFASTAPSAALVEGSGYTVSALGGASGSSVVFTIDDLAAAICSIEGFVISFIGAGDCLVNANQAGSENYVDAAQVQQTFSVAKGVQLINFDSVAPANASVNGSAYKPLAFGGNSTSAVEISIDSGSALICSISAGEITFQTPGDCVVNANQAGDSNYLVANQVQQTFQVSRGLQVLAFTTSAPTGFKVGASSYNLAVSGGAGTSPIVITLDADSVGVCSLNGTEVSPLTSGNCSIHADQAGDTNFNPADQITQTFFVDKGAQTLEFSSTAPLVAVVDGETFTPTAIGGNSTSLISIRTALATSGVCSSNSGVVSFVGVGTCTIVASQLGDENYYSAVSVSQSFSVGQGSQSIVFTSLVPSSAVVGGPAYTPAATGGASNNNVTLSVDPSSASVCRLVAGRVTFQTAGDCVLNAAQAGNTNYLAADPIQQTISVGKGSQVLTFNSAAPTSAKVGGSNYGAEASGGASGKAVTFSIPQQASTICSVDSLGSVSFIGAGTCVVEADQLGDSNYLAATKISQTFVVAKGIQVLVFTSTPPHDAEVDGLSYVPTATGGDSGKPVVFSVPMAAAAFCYITGGVVYFTTPGDCIVRASQIGDDNWNAAATQRQVFDVTKGQQVITFTSGSPIDAVVSGSSYSPTVSGGAGLGAVAYTIVESSMAVCSVVAGQVQFDSPGLCEVQADKAGDVNYNEAAPITQSFTIGKGSQLLSFTTSFSDAKVDGSAYELGSLAGQSSNEVIYSIAIESLSVCEVFSGVVYFRSVGECVIEANQAPDSRYLAAATITQSISVERGNQSILSVSSTVNTLTLGSTAPTTVISGSGGSGTGELTWLLSESSFDICSISGDVVTGLSVGECRLTAIKAGDLNYLDEVASLVLTVSSGGQASVQTVVSNQNPDFATGLELTLSLTGGSGDGLVWFESLTPNICEVASLKLLVRNAGECSIVGHKNGDDFFTAIANTLTFTIAKASQVDLGINLANALTYSPAGAVSSAITTSGVKSENGSSLAVISGPCSIGEGNLSATAAGDCVVEVTAMSDGNYLETTFRKTFVIGKANQSSITATLVAGKPAQIAFNGVSSTEFAVGGGSGEGIRTALSATPLVCSVALSSNKLTVTAINQGECRITLTQASTINYLVGTKSITITSVSLPGAVSALTATYNESTVDGNKVSIGWVAPVSDASRATISGFEVQQSADGTTWTTSENGLIIDASKTSLDITVPAWTAVFLRVAPTSALDSVGAVRTNWTNYTGDGLLPVAFQVAGALAAISTNVAAVTSGEVVTLTGDGFDPEVTTQVAITSQTAVFGAGFGRAAATRTVTLSARVISPTKLEFTLPKIKLPAGTVRLASTVRVISTSGMQSSPLSFDYIPKKLAQKLIATLPANSLKLNVGSTDQTGSASSNGMPPTVIATPSSVCTASLDNTGRVRIVAVGRGTCNVSIQAIATPGYLASAVKKATYKVLGASQSITFGVLQPRIWSADPIALVALSSSALPVTYRTSTPAFCSVSGSAVSLLKASGKCTIIASQGGSASSEPAVDVAQTFAIAKANRTAGLNATVIGTDQAGVPTEAQVFDMASALAGKNVSVALGENPLEIPVVLNRAEGVVFTVLAADEKAGRCTAASGTDVPTIGSITITDLGSCTVTLSLPSDERWNVSGETVVIRIVSVATTSTAPPVDDSDGLLSADPTDTVIGADADTMPAVVMAMSGNEQALLLGDGADLSYDPVTGTFKFKQKTLLAGNWKIVMNSPSVANPWFKVKGKVVKKVQTFKNVSSCSLSFVVKKNPKLKNRVVRQLGTCQLNDLGKAAFNLPGIQKIKTRFVFNRQYPSSGLSYVKQGSAKVRFLKPTKRTYILKVGR